MHPLPVPAAVLFAAAALFLCGCRGGPENEAARPDPAAEAYERAWLAASEVLAEEFDVVHADKASGILRASPRKAPKERFGSDPADPVMTVKALVSRKRDGTADVEVWVEPRDPARRDSTFGRDTLFMREENTGSSRFTLPGENRVLEQELRDRIIRRCGAMRKAEGR